MSQTETGPTQVLFEIFLYTFFTIYLIALTLITVYLGLNHYRIRDKRKVYPEIITFMLPFLINFLLSKTIFYDINAFLSTLLPCIGIYLIGRRLKSVRILGLTGGIACGKSVLINLIDNNLPMDIIDCDQISHKLNQRGNKGYQIILDMLGDAKADYINIYTKQIEKDKLGSYIFENPAFRKKLTTKVGKYIFLEILKRIFSNIMNGKNLMLIDAPILFETKVLEYICYPIILVGCRQETQIERLMTRNKYSEHEALNWIRSQMPLDAKKKKATIYLLNQGTKEELFHNCLAKLNRYMGKNKLGK